MTIGFDPIQVDWNNPSVNYLMGVFEKMMVEHRDEVDLLTKLNKQLVSENEQAKLDRGQTILDMEQVILDKEQAVLDKKQTATKNKELEKKYSQLEAKYDKLIELYNVLTGGAGNDIDHILSPGKSSTRSDTSPKQYKSGRKSRYNVRDFVNYPRPEPPAPITTYLPARANMVRKDALADELTCRTCGSVLSRPTAQYEKVTEDVIDHHWQETSWVINRRWCAKCHIQQTSLTDGVMKKEHYGVNIMSMVVQLRCMVDSFENIRRIIHMFYGALIPRSVLNRFCDKAADALEPLYQQIRKDLNASKRINGDTTGWYIDGDRSNVWTFIGNGPDGESNIFYEIDKSAGKDVPMRILDKFKGIVGSDSAGCWNYVGTEYQKCLLHYFRDMYRTTKDNESSEFSLFFMELHDILKDAIDTKGYESEDIVESLKYRVQCLISKEYTDEDCKRYVKRLRRESDSLFTFLMNDVEYHNNVSERALRKFATYRQILYGNKTENGARRTKIIMSIHATCEQRGVDFGQLLQDCLSGKVKSIPPRAKLLPVIA